MENYSQKRENIEILSIFHDYVDKIVNLEVIIEFLQYESRIELQ